MHSSGEFDLEVRKGWAFAALQRELILRWNLIEPQSNSLGVSERSGYPMNEQKKILLFTSSEYGQANVILAVAYEMLDRQQHEIHIASFGPLKGRVESLNELFEDNHVPATFHTVFGPSALEALTEKNESIGESSSEQE